jgi:hypothetical protein
MFGKPADYLAKAQSVLSIAIENDLIAACAEMKASRDLIVHNNGQINRLYLDKAGRLARGQIGSELSIDEDYFEEVIKNAKLLSGTIQRETEKKYR